MDSTVASQPEVPGFESQMEQGLSVRSLHALRLSPPKTCIYSYIGIVLMSVPLTAALFDSWSCFSGVVR